MKKKVEVSIVIVQYKVKKILLSCIQSIIIQTKNINYEIIVVDNDEIKNLKVDLYKKFPEVVYIPNENKGFGQGNNVGASVAKGEYLFFLNPDTRLINNAVFELLQFLKKDKKIGIVAPILTHENKSTFELQGLSTLTPIRGVMALSFINKLFPTNRISKRYWLSGWDKSKKKMVDVVPGTAFMISKKLYEQVRGFDENFFLYFEEFDLCKRIVDLGYKIFIIPNGKVEHLWGKSTSQRNDINAVFAKSRFYYFKKHFGVLSGLIVEMFTRASISILFKALLLILSLFLLLYQLPTLMTFIGDQAWFYLSARDMLMGKEVPLVGITSSHTWLHQGALWTYLLAAALWLGNFNPVSGGYLSVVVGFLTIITLYVVTRTMLGEKVALASSILYITSPLVILHVRMPYHTTPIPLFTLLYFLSLYLWIRGNNTFFGLSLFFLAILYNLELATVVLLAPLLLISLFGFIKKQKYIKTLTIKNIYHSLLFMLIPMIPVLIYDSTHGFRQTIVFGGWLVMNGLRTIGITFYQTITPEQSINIYEFTYSLFQKLIFLPHGVIALGLLITSVVYALQILIKQIIERKVNAGLLLSILWFTLTIIFYFGNKTPSEAYLPMLFPVVFILIAYFLSALLRGRLLFIIIIGIICILNVVYLLKDNYLTSNPSSVTLQMRENITQKIIVDSSGNPFQIKGKGSGSQFESFLMPYEYLLWLDGYAPSKTKQENVFILEEREGRVKTTNKL